MAVWFLILALGGQQGAVSVPMPSEAACRQAMINFAKFAVHGFSIGEAMCLDTTTGQFIRRM